LCGLVEPLGQCFEVVVEQIPHTRQPHERRTDSGGVDERWRTVAGPEAGLGGAQPVAAQVVVGGYVEVDQPVLSQLHHGDRGEGLGYGADPRHRVSVMGVFDVMSASP
jgi:hypothetical protein